MARSDAQRIGRDPGGGHDPVGEVKEAVALSNADLAMVTGGTAARLLAIEARR